MKKEPKNKSPRLTIADVKKRFAELEEPNLPVHQRFKTNDATVPKLHELLSTNDRGLLIIRDELKGLLASLDQEEAASDKAFYLQGWNGYGSFIYDRIGRGTVFTDNVCLSLFGTTQPDKIRSYLYSAMRGGNNDGTPQRLQLAIYPDDIDWSYVDQFPNADKREQAYKILKDLAHADFTKYGATLDQGEKIPYFRFSPEAQEFFKSWLTDLEVNRLRAKDEPVLLEHLSKYRSLMPSLALIIHLVEVISNNSNVMVSLEAAQKAAAWCDFLEQHARRIYWLAINIRQKAALNLAEKLLDKKLVNGFTTRDVYIHGWSYLATVDETQAAINELVVKNWLKELEGKKTIRYQINPRIYKRKTAAAGD